LDIKIKINISILNGSSISTSLTLGPAKEPQQSSLDKLLKRLEWPYNYSTDGALLPSISLPSDLAVVTK
jgi:hypothetical protein